MRCATLPRLSAAGLPSAEGRGLPWWTYPLAGLWLPAIVLGFILWWPLGLAVLAAAAVLKPMLAQGRLAFPSAARLRDALPRASSGNTAFDAHRAAVLARLEEERRELDVQQAEFAAFLEQLRRAKDQEEFDRFMAGRRS